MFDTSLFNEMNLTHPIEPGRFSQSSQKPVGPTLGANIFPDGVMLFAVN